MDSLLERIGRACQTLKQLPTLHLLLPGQLAGREARPRNADDVQSLLDHVSASLLNTLTSLRVYGSRIQRSFQPDIEALDLFSRLSQSLESDVDLLSLYFNQVAQGVLPEDGAVTDIAQAVSFLDELFQACEEYLHFVRLQQDLNQSARVQTDLQKFETLEIELEKELATGIFECKPSELLPSNHAAKSSTISRSPNPFKVTFTISALLLRKIHGAASQLSGNFPHDTSADDLLDMALYWLSSSKVVQKEYSVADSAITNGHVYWGLVKTGWLLYCINHHHLLQDKHSVRYIALLLTKRTMSMLHAAKESELPEPHDFVNLDAAIARPARFAHQTLSLQSTSSVSGSSSSQAQSNDPKPMDLAQYVPTGNEEEMENAEAPKQDLDYLPGFYKDIKAGEHGDRRPNTATIDFQTCYVRVFRERGVPAKFKICTSISEQTTAFQCVNYKKPVELIPEYAYIPSSRAIWFRDEQGNAGKLCYSFDKGSSQIFSFRAIFTTDEWLDTFDHVEKAVFFHSSSSVSSVSSSISPSLSTPSSAKTEISAPVVEVWEDPPVEAGTAISVHSLSPTQDKPRRTSQRIESLQIKYSPSKLVILGNRSIYTLFITDHVHFKSPNPKLVQIRPTKGNDLRVKYQAGSVDRPAGIVLNDKVAFYEKELTFSRCAGIDLHFTWSAWEQFERRINDELTRWDDHQRKIRSARSTQQNPDVKTRSFFSFSGNTK